MQLQVQAHSTPNVFDALGDSWNALLKNSSTNTLFLTREWQRTWWASLGEGDLRVLTMRDGENLIGIAPLFFEQDALGGVQVTFVGCKEVSDYLDFIFAKGRERECLGAVLDFLSGEASPVWNTISLCNMPEASPNLALLQELAAARGWKANAVFEDVCPIIALPESFEAYLGSLDSKERRELSRKLRRAEDDATVIYATDSARLDIDVDDFLRLMRASLVSKDSFMTPRMERFFHASSQAMFDAGFLQLAFLEVSGERAAAYLNFVWDNQVLVYNSGLDPMKFAYLSPGQVLIARLIEKAIADKRASFDFLQGNEDYKYKLGGKDVKLFTLGITR
jgi:CelD/BcsL family acetyltransferase involved in cellulose biosynthesis